MATAKESLTWYKKASKKYVDRFLAKWQEEAKSAGQVPQEMIKKFADLYPRGKQLRGALAVLGYQVAGGKNLEEILKASIVMELMETSILIADDVFDDDEIRRGVPTIHKQWEKKLQPTTYNLQARQHYGHSMAHTTAIIGFHLAPLALVKTGFSKEVRERALNFYCRSLIQTAFGEALDITSSWQALGQKQAWSQQIHDSKTVWYSAILPLTFGALLAGKQEGKWLDNLKRYGQTLGRVFQIQDDIIGSFGDPEKTGKSNTSDIAQGRWTVLIELLWKKATQEEQQALKKIFEKKTRGIKEIRQVKSFMLKYQIVELARQRAGRYLHRGLKIIPRLTKDREYQETMRDLLRFMIRRVK